MRLRKQVFALLIALNACALWAADSTATLVVHVDGVNKTGGNIGVLVFRDDKGWPENNDAAFRRVVVPAHPGSVVVEIPNLPVGDYAIAVGHDTNVNHHVDKNMFGKPTEQWGMSNNPRALLRAPSFNRAKFRLSQSADIHIQLQ